MCAEKPKRKCWCSLENPLVVWVEQMVSPCRCGLGEEEVLKKYRGQICDFKTDSSLWLEIFQFQWER